MNEGKQNQQLDDESTGVVIKGIKFASLLSMARDILNPKLPKPSRDAAMRFYYAAGLEQHRKRLTEVQLELIDQAKAACAEELGGISLLIAGKAG